MPHKKTADLPRVVVLGGGNGTSRLLSALLPLVTDKKIHSLHAIVQMADDGGSTGRLRDQYGVAAVGDLTKCLLALSSFHGDIRGEEFLKALEYRFANGDFQGHTLRNMFLTALEKTSDIDAAVATMARILQIPKYAGVVPATLRTLTQQVVIHFEGQSNLLGEGEHFIAHNVNLQADLRWRPGDVQVTFKEGDVALNLRAAKLLQEATHIIVAPGHTYGTILPTLALPALQRAVQHSKAQLYVVMTLLTTPRQTTDWSGEDFMRVYESYLGRAADVVITNTAKPNVELVAGQEWVQFQEAEHPYQLIQEELAGAITMQSLAGDVVPRAIVTHDSAKMRALLAPLLVY